jgi:predicted amidophosphoribosyltransferase
MTTLDKLENLGIATQDNICVFCSSRFDRWDSICRKCKDYKGVMNVVKAVDVYGIEIIGY